MHDHNTNKFIECIKTSHEICGSNNLIAIKVTALVRPSVLKKFNTLLKSLENRSLLPPLFELINQEQTNEKTVTFFQQSIESHPIKDQVIQLREILCTLKSRRDFFLHQEEANHKDTNFDLKLCP
jgi:hypothetical protein